MAKLNGPYGSKMRGKVGEVVAAKTVGGQTVIRSYQPNVKNPNTRRQQAARSKFAALSELAAMVANVVQIGFGKAVQGMNMYPRNLFLREAYGSSDVYSGGMVDYNELQVSKLAGLYARPVGATAVYTAGTGLTCKVGAETPIEAEDGNALGVVFAAVQPDSKQTIVAAGSVATAKTTGLVITEANLVVGVQYYVYAFLKEMEPTGTEIDTDEYPWKYPSNTGASVLVDVVTPE